MWKEALLATAIASITACSSSGNGAAEDAHSAPPLNARKLNANEIKTELIGKKISSVTQSGYPFSEVLNADGSSILKIPSEPTQSGNWTLKGDIICTNYKKYGEECNTIVTDGTSFWSIDSIKNTTNNKFSVQR